MNDQTNYSGKDELEILDSADNYTYSITSQICNFFSKDKVALDFGAGAGTFAKKLRNSNLEVECLEIDPDLTNILTSLNFKVHRDLSGFKHSSVAQIYSINVLEHIEDDLNILKKLKDILIDDGKLYLYLPAFPILYSKFDKKIGHFRRYKRADLSDKLREAGFKIEKMRYRDSVGFLVAFIFKLISNSDTVSKKSVYIYDRLLFPFSKFVDPLLSRFFGKNIEVLAIK